MYVQRAGYACMTYISISHTLVVTGDDWTECFTVPGVVLPTAPFLGFSALTGDVFDAHEYVPDFCSSPDSSSQPVFVSFSLSISPVS